VARGVLVVASMGAGAKRVSVCSIGEAFGAQLPMDPFPLSCSTNDPAFLKLRLTPPVVREAGERLYGALVEHQPLRDFFLPTNPAPAPPPAGVAEFPLYIRMDAPEAEAYPWEVMYEQQKEFMALDTHGRWPIARLVGTTGRPQTLERIMVGELRMAVVLAAARESGVDEWTGIAAAIDKFDVPLDLLVIVSEEAAKAAVEADAAKWQATAPGRKVAVVFASDAASLLVALRAHVPNIVHFFCHGQVDGNSSLEVESRADRKVLKQNGSIRLNGNALSILGGIAALWLVVLNCCKGAGAAPQLHSLAREIVASGVPSVAAMRESVDVSDANVFSEQFYAGLFPQLKVLFGLIGAPGQSLKFQEITWLRAMQRARLQLASGRQPESSAQWTYPVLYVHRDDLRLLRKELKPLTLGERTELLADLDTLR